MGNYQKNKQSKSIKIAVEEEKDIEENKVFENAEMPIKSSCSLWSVLILLVLILVLFIGVMFYFGIKKSFSISWQKVNQNTNSNIGLDEIKNGEIIQVNISEKQLGEAIGIRQNNFPLKNAEIKINPNQVVISGKTGGFFSAGVSVGLRPKIVDQKVKFDIVEVKSAGVSAPKLITDEVNKNLGGYLDSLSASLNNNLFVSEIKLFDGYLTLTGRTN